jgi:hypothetical protein
MVVVVVEPFLSAVTLADDPEGCEPQAPSRRQTPRLTTPARAIRVTTAALFDKGLGTP